MGHQAGSQAVLKVIGAGFGRTGTLSLKIALETLGFGPCYHFTELLRRRHEKLWLRLSEGGPPDWETIFSGYQSVTDWPAASYYRELAAYYPDARIILGVRDAVGWHRSVLDTIYRLRRRLPIWLPRVGDIARLTDNVIWNGEFDGRITDRTHAIAVFEKHNAEVRRSIDASRLLVFDPREGWEPLCRFLQVPVPKGVEFPRVNEARSIRWMIRMLQALKALPLVLAILVVWMIRS